MGQNMPANGGFGYRIVEDRGPRPSRSQVPVTKALVPKAYKKPAPSAQALRATFKPEQKYRRPTPTAQALRASFGKGLEQIASHYKRGPVSTKAIRGLQGRGMNPHPQFQAGPGANKLESNFRLQGRPGLARRAGAVQQATHNRKVFAQGKVKNSFQPNLSSFQTSGVGKSLSTKAKIGYGVGGAAATGAVGWSVSPSGQRMQREAKAGGLLQRSGNPQFRAADRAGRRRMVSGLVDQVDASRASKSFSKAQRYYDPEHRRQRRMGLQEAALLGAGGALIYRGGRGIKETTQGARKLTGAQAGMIGGRKRDIAQVAAGVGSVGGAGTINYQGNHERGKHWR